MGKMGVYGLHSTCTFKILTYSRGQFLTRIGISGTCPNNTTSTMLHTYSDNVENYVIGPQAMRW